MTPKQEKFARLYVELGNASEAYRQAYDAARMKQATVASRASELLSDGNVTAMIEKLRNQHAQRHAVTVDTLIVELEQARLAALTCETPQSGAAVTATMGKAKLLGLDKQVIQHVGSDGKSIDMSLTVKLIKAHG